MAAVACSLKAFSLAAPSAEAAAFLALCWPFIDARIRRLRPRSEASVWIGALAVLGLIALTLWEALAAH